MNVWNYRFSIRLYDFKTLDSFFVFHIFVYYLAVYFLTAKFAKVFCHELHEFTRIKNRGTNNQITDSTIQRLTDSTNNS